MEAENTEVFDKLVKLLTDKGIEHKITEHEPTATSEESAKVRGATLASGAKAMLLKYEASKGSFSYVLAVLSAEKKINLKTLKKILKTKNMKIADSDEALKVTKCVPGAVPPFGSLFGIPTYLDNSLIKQGEDTNFNAGLRTKSCNMKVKDYIKVENPIISDYTD
eukprot:TRINITY_DN3639_c0_g5_i3.p1 TRINITY_DN3639_c0_g5~~TRINITY_DN3639_c0_g5_i3.p1  ORF type:complete len:165 (+),score=49.42 TRINITY_DN3639_c0_g5_i3:125-619(+)